MKKIFLFVGILCAGIITTWSCSSDDKGVAPQDETFDIELGMNLQDLGVGTKDASVPGTSCLSEDQLYDMQTNSTTADDVEAIVKLKKKKGSVETLVLNNAPVKMRGVMINGKKKLVTDVIVVPFETGATYTIEEMKVQRKSDGYIHYGTILQGSPAYIQNSTMLSGCVTNNVKTIEPKKFDKVYHELCLHCMQDIAPEDFGLSILTPNYHKHYCINFVVDLCGNATNPNDPDKNQDKLGSGTYEVFRAVLNPGQTSPDENQWVLIGSGNYGKHGLTNDQAGLGKICFYDDPKVDNDKEWYTIRLKNLYEPLINYYIETVPKCPVPPGVVGPGLGQYKRGVPLTKMLAMLTEAGHKPGGLISNNTVVHFWWCRPIASMCAPNEYSWPTKPDGSDEYTWYDVQGQ